MAKKNQAKQSEEAREDGELATQVPPEGEEFLESSPTKTRKIAQEFTYVGGGEDSPRVIKFMGIQEFVRGQLTKVNDPRVLEKIKNNPCFVEGAVDEKTLHMSDVAAKKAADTQRVSDRQLQTNINRTMCKWNTGNDE